MAIFTYTTKDFQGNYHKGEIESLDEQSAATILRRKKLIVINIKLKSERGKKFIDKYFNKVSFSEIVIMTRQLATMIGAGLVLSEAIDLLSEEQLNKKLKLVLEEIASDIKGGISFAAALEKHPDIFPKLYINLVKVGEISGKLDIILLQLATHLEKDREFQSKVKGAMIYPVIVISMMLMVMLIMIFFVMPRLISLYSQSNIELPLPTKIMVAGSTFIINFWWAILAVIIAAFFGFQYWMNKGSGRGVIDKKILSVPAIGHIVVIVILTNFTRTFGLLVSAGIPILESIKISQEVVGNKAFEEALAASYQGVERGLPFSAQILGQPVFPKIIGQMIKTGEETGKLDEILTKLADYFESETDNALKNITTLIEPLILLVLGVGVALLVLSIILPIYKLTTNIS